MTKKFKTPDMVYSAVGAVIIAIASQIMIPFSAVPFTLQTFGVALTLVALGGKRGTVSSLVYILMGAVGIPVFSGFKGGVGHLVSLTGGYIVGFLVMGIVYLIFENALKNKFNKLGYKILALAIGNIFCYVIGTVWFYVVSMKNGSGYGFLGILTLCVFPYIVPDAVKIYVAAVTGKILRKAISKNEK